MVPTLVFVLPDSLQHVCHGATTVHLVDLVQSSLCIIPPFGDETFHKKPKWFPLTELQLHLSPFISSELTGWFAAIDTRNPLFPQLL